MSKETNLTSLKVYGNDDPAGSVYKVSGGGESSNGLVLYMAMEASDNSRVEYLTHEDGSIVTWREIRDAMLRGIAPVVVTSNDQDTNVYHARILGAYINDGLYCVRVDESNGLQSRVFSASTESDRLELETTSPIGGLGNE